MNRNIVILSVILSVLFQSTSLSQSRVDYPQGEWQAHWITHPSAPLRDYGVFHFRNSFTLDSVPQQLYVHVSADNRYRLFVNGTPVAFGPARGDLLNWFFESIDIAPYLKSGKNTLAAQVWNAGEYKPMAQVTNLTAFILQSDSAYQRLLNTGNANWKVLKNEAYQPINYEVNDRKLKWQYYVAGALDSLQMAAYPWGWELTEYNDAGWLEPKTFYNGNKLGYSIHSQWELTPRRVALLETKTESFARILESEGVKSNEDFIKGLSNLSIPAHTNARIVVDRGELTYGYPQLMISGGTGASIKIVYAEALVDAQGNKGHRAELKGKKVFGVYDVLVADGGNNRLFRPLWARTFRFIELQIETGNQPLILEKMNSEYTAYPAKLKARFESNNPELSAIFNASWHTQRLCAQETFVSDLYYEQMQYLGDTRVQAVTFFYLTGNADLFKLAIQQFNDSRVPGGLTQSRYPSEVYQFTPVFSLLWVSMVYDYWMLTGDTALVKQCLPGIRGVLGWFESHLNSKGMIEPLPYLDFTDHIWGKRRNQLVSEHDKSSAQHSLMFAYVLQQASQLTDRFGTSCETIHYNELSARLTQTVRTRCWDDVKGLMSDSPSKRYFSQQTNTMALLSGAVTHAEAPSVFETMMRDTSVLPMEVYYRFFMGRALNKTGLGDLYLQHLKPWEQFIAQGMKTFPEVDINPRSECHAWSSSPAYEFLATICGIEPASPGFATVRIAPHPGNLTRLNGSVPHPNGTINLNMQRGKKGWEVQVSLPEGVSGTFTFKGHERSLQSGNQFLNFDF